MPVISSFTRDEARFPTAFYEALDQEITSDLFGNWLRVAFGDYADEVRVRYPLTPGERPGVTPRTPAQERLANRMLELWTAFARTGDPNTAGHIDWQADGGRQVMALLGGDQAPRMYDAATLHQCDFWVQVP